MQYNPARNLAGVVPNTLTERTFNSGFDLNLLQKTAISNPWYQFGTANQLMENAKTVNVVNEKFSVSLIIALKDFQWMIVQG